MIVQGLNKIATAYGSAAKSPTSRQTSPASPANYAEKVSISDAAKALMNNYQTKGAEDSAIQKHLADIKSRPAVERSDADYDYLSKYDKRFIELQDKIKASGLDGFDSLTADEVDYMQKAGGFVNTMSYLSPGEKTLYDDLVAKGNSEAAHGLLLVGMSRIGMGGQQVTLPNGKTFDPLTTEVTADNIRNLFKFMFVDPGGNTDRQFDALASYLERKEATNQAASKA